MKIKQILNEYRTRYGASAYVTGETEVNVSHYDILFVVRYNDKKNKLIHFFISYAFMYGIGLVGAKLIYIIK